GDVAGRPASTRSSSRGLLLGGGAGLRGLHRVLRLLLDDVVALALVDGLLDGLLHQDESVLAAGHVAAHEEDVLVGQDVEELEVLHRLALVAHVAAHALALVDAAGGEAAADGAAVAEELVRAVRGSRAAQLVALEHALE